MAKFAIALYILLVASVTSGAELTFELSYNSKTATNYYDGMEKAQEKLIEAFEAAKNFTEAFIASAENAMQTATVGFENSVNELVAGYGNVSTCVSSSTNFTQTAKTILNNTITCAKGVLSDIVTDFEKTINSSRTLITQLKEVGDEAKACESKYIWDVVTCLAQVGFSNANEIFTNAAQVIKDVASTTANFNNISTNLQICGLSSAIGTIVVDGKKAYEDIKACLEAANPTSA